MCVCISLSHVFLFVYGILCVCVCVCLFYLLVCLGEKVIDLWFLTIAKVI